jgi:hypothetical protein
MPNIKNWSSTAANNNSSPPNGWPEDMQLSDINNSARQNMADVRGFAEELPFFDYGHTPTRTGATTFTVATDLTATYTVGRRIKCTDSSTLYGTISVSSYGAPNTTVTVVLDSGSLSTSLTAVALGSEITGKGISGESIRGGTPRVNTISENTSAAGVTVDGVLLKDAKVTATGGVDPNASGGITMSVFDIGTYMPTTTNVTNVSASAAFASTNYVRVNNQVLVYGRIDINPVAAGAVEVGLSLPVASAFSGSIQGGGACNCIEINQHLGIVPDTTNARLKIVGIVTDTAERQYSFFVMYRVV